ncbi:hypothetical protein JQS43_09390 [Natronosporangium hydrolyticum]|uniref:Uncharacterized protein n=1 Tax=Natronosporangium hydrolyticum TaxID=2811111 RepID=A0A895YP24_9ACTN|nr:hypothetical protein [Natronosporangium hydrolyticum]QSB16466.1 hypothetical protein JQS43_09390 [Natronosporangium hydrolyticum]
MALLTASLLVATSAACGDDTDDLPPAPASPAPQGTSEQEPVELELTAEEQDAVDEVRERFDEFMTAYVDVLTAGEGADIDTIFQVNRYAADQASIDVHEQIVDNFLADQVADGTLDWEFLEVVEVDFDRIVADRESPQIQLRYCLDATDWRVVERDGGATVTEPLGQHTALITGRYSEQRSDTGAQGWRIAGWDNEETPC